MRNDTDSLIRTLIWGMFSLAVGATCLLVTARAEVDPISLNELASGGSSLLMSCADDDPGGEPMWCSNPDSPHCSPALPKPSAPDIAHGPVATLPSAPALVGALDYGWLKAWPAPRAEQLCSLRLKQRLDRPPRSV